MQSIAIVVLSTLALANAGVLTAVQTPVVHATPVVHHVPTHTFVQTAPTLYHTGVGHLPVTYAHTYKYRAAPAKIAVATAPVVVAAPQPIVKAIVPTAYASTYSYRAPPAKLAVVQKTVVQPVVHHVPTVVATPVVHKTVVSAPVVHHTVVASPVVHKTVVSTPLVHHAPTVLVH